MDNYRAHVLVCCGTGCTSSSSAKIMDKLNELVKAKGLENDCKIVKTGCFGLCAQGPIVVVKIGDHETMYYRVTVDDAEEIISMITGAHDQAGIGL